MVRQLETYSRTDLYESNKATMKLVSDGLLLDRIYEICILVDVKMFNRLFWQQLAVQLQCRKVVYG